MVVDERWGYCLRCRVLMCGCLAACDTPVEIQTLTAALPCEWRVNRPLQAEQPPKAGCCIASTHVRKQKGRGKHKTTQ